MSLRFDGRVAVVTGAGGGLGKEYALLLASRGAKVVVNDLGVNRHGVGKSSNFADEVVDLIRSKGGTAVASYDSVEEGEKIVKTAIETFGRIDILINNAGILRDRSFIRMSPEEWDLVHRVHLRGSFLVTQAAWPHMREQKYGRIIMTSSTSGLYGNFGQTNYAAAKMGLVGLSNTLALEGAKYNISCNALAPVAYSRLTADLYPPEFEPLMKAEYVAPFVTYLCHEDCKDTGSIFEAGGGWAAKLQLQQSEGVLLKKPFSVEDVRDKWKDITDMSKAILHTDGKQAAMYVNNLLMEEADQTSTSSAASEKGGDTFVGKVIKCPPFTYTHRDIILYAMGVGVTVSRQDMSDLKFLYEGHEDFSVLPSYAVIPAMTGGMGNIFLHGIPGLKDFNLAQALHGEQYVELKRPMPSAATTLYSEGRIEEVVDKKSGALVVVGFDTKTEDGELLCVNQMAIFIIGAGGFGGKQTSSKLKPIVRIPDRAPDATRQEKTFESQAALYRLNGDYNPLHIDPAFAAMGGFKDPILHGLCSYGIATRHVLKQYCNNDVSKVKAIKARFSKPMLPGHTLQTEMWEDGTRILFRCKAVETGNIVLNGGYIELTGPPVKASSTASPESSPPSLPPSPGPTAGDGLQSTAMFEQMQQMVSAMPDLVDKVKAIFLWVITKDGKHAAKWTVDLKNKPGSIYRGTPKKGQKPGCTLTVSDEHFVDLTTGKMSGQQAFFQGKMKVAGNIMLSQKLQNLFTAQSKL